MFNAVEYVRGEDDLCVCGNVLLVVQKWFESQYDLDANIFIFTV